MSLNTLVKISGVNNLSDARYCAGMGAAILGFCPEADHPDYVDPGKFNEITGWVQGVKVAGEFYHSSMDQIREIVAEYNFDFLQVTDSGLVVEVSALQKPVIYQVDLNQTDNIEEVRDQFERLKDLTLFYIIEGRNIVPDRMKIVGQLADKFPVLTGIDVTEENVIEILKQFNFHGLSLKGGSEIKPGYYDFGELAGILELLDAGD